MSTYFNRRRSRLIAALAAVAATAAVYGGTAGDDSTHGVQVARSSWSSLPANAADTASSSDTVMHTMRSSWS